MSDSARMSSRTALACLLPLLAVDLFPRHLHGVMTASSYVTFRNITEFFSIMVALSIFGRGSCFSLQAGRSFPTLIIAGDTAPERIKEVHDGGFAMLHKPVAPQELMRKLELPRWPVEAEVCAG